MSKSEQNSPQKHYLKKSCVCTYARICVCVYMCVEARRSEVTQVAFLVLHLILRLSLADSDRLAGQGGLPSALTTDALVWAFFFFFNLDSRTQVPIHVHITSQSQPLGFNS